MEHEHGVLTGGLSLGLSCRLALTQVVALEQQVLVHAELPAELDEVLHVVSGEEGPTRRRLEAAPLDAGRGLDPIQRKF